MGEWVTQELTVEWKCQPVSQIQPLSLPQIMAQINPPGFTENTGSSSSVIKKTQYQTRPGCSRSDPMDSRDLFARRAAVMDLSLHSGDNLTGHSFHGRRVGIRFSPRDKEVDQI